MSESPKDPMSPETTYPPSSDQPPETSETSETPVAPEPKPASSADDVPPDNGSRTADQTAVAGEAASVDSPPESSPPPGTGGQSDESNASTASEPDSTKQAPAPEVRSGRVLRLTPEAIIVDLGDEQYGSLPLIEYAGQALPQVGDEVRVLLEHKDEETGHFTVSKRQAEELGFWQTVKPGDVLEGVVTGMNRGGLDIDLGGARAFLPGSQVDVRRVKDISVLIGEHVRCVVTQVDRTTHDIVVSRRKAMERDRKEQRAAAIEKLNEGDIVEGTVKNLTDFGAFVSLDGVEGLLHVTDMSWGRIQHPSEMVQPGQTLQVKILKVNKQTGKVSLGHKQIKPDPWLEAGNKYSANTKVKGRVVRFADFGAFIELEEGLEALLPVSEMSWSKHVKHPSELVKLGDEVELMVLKVDPAKRRISLGLKQTEENPWDKLANEYAAESKATGKVSKITDFGAFVEIMPGVEGLVHISELSEQRVRSVGDVVQEGQEVEVRVLKIDRAAQRVSLSMKPEPKVSAHAGADSKSPKKRKKPLRGGLSNPSIGDDDSPVSGLRLGQ